MSDIRQSLFGVLETIRQAEIRYDRRPGSVSLLAVSKTKPAEDIRAAFTAGQHAFGENHLQEGLTKMETLSDLAIEWHFIGPIQSNKTRAIAEAFDWVHSVDRAKVASRLSSQRPTEANALNVCVQVNISGEDSKAGVGLEEVGELCTHVQSLPGLSLRGLMAIPRPESDFARQREAFAKLRHCLEGLNGQGFSMDTLSMGMSGDMEAAIAEGATIVRIGTAVFGAR